MKRVHRHRLSAGPQARPRAGSRVGLLGGGQLARMLALKGHEMGLEIHVLSQSLQDPAAQVVRHHHKGDPGNETDLRAFFASVDLVTFESEFMDAELLEKISAETKIAVHPKPKIMGRLQDRLHQKQFLQDNNIPTAAYQEVSDAKDAEAAYAKFKGNVVFKKRRFGYDGYGTYVVRDSKSLRAAIEAVESDPFGFIAEEFVPFKRELAVMIARNVSGEVLAFPFVESFQENSRCLWVKGPISNASGASRLPKKLEVGLAKIGYCGILGVELFDTKMGILVNELAPRVHNSAHYSLDALSEDQFTVHWKAVLDLAFSPVRILSGGFAMYNLLGSHSGAPTLAFPADAVVHWYGKAENRPGRKMGHLNVVAASPLVALKKAKAARAEFDV